MSLIVHSSKHSQGRPGVVKVSAQAGPASQASPLNPTALRISQSAAVDRASGGTGAPSGGTIRNAYGIPFKRTRPSIVGDLPNPILHPLQFAETPIGPYVVSVVLGTIVLGVAA